MSTSFKFTVPVADAYREILSPQALNFLENLCREFEPRRQAILADREKRQKEFDAGKKPDFNPDTVAIRNGDWKVAPYPEILKDRRVEITGPTDRKMLINSLNSGANVSMADFEDSTTPTWSNSVEGQLNIRDAINGTIQFTNENGKEYRLNPNPSLLFVRPRGWHLNEKHMLLDGKPISGSLFDFGLFFFHNAKTLLSQGKGPWFYLPKLEGYLEARLWNDIFVAAQKALDLPVGTIKATVLVETVLATFEMDEILYELRDHSVGLNSGRWDYIFSCIKKFRKDPEFVLANRDQLSMTSPFMRAYALLLVKTCHRRGTFAMGGMAAQIPIKNDTAANEKALSKVREDKTREVLDGYDGTWVAHPGLVNVAKEIFDQHLTTPNQISRQRDDVNYGAADLLDFRPRAPISEAGLRVNINIGLQYLGSWLAGTGCVPIHHLMEDAATAEISRAQIWQWIRSPHGILDDGRKITVDLFRSLIPQELDSIRAELGEAAWAAGKYPEAAKMFDDLTTAEDFVEFLTLPGYDFID
jgi:malate synthase